MVAKRLALAAGAAVLLVAAVAVASASASASGTASGAAAAASDGLMGPPSDPALRRAWWRNHDAKCERWARSMRKLVSEWHHSESEQRALIRYMIKAVNLGYAGEKMSWLDVLFAKLQSDYRTVTAVGVPLKGYSTYSELWGRKTFDRETQDVADALRIVHAPFHRDDKGVTFSLADEFADDFWSGDMGRRAIITLKNIPVGAYGAITGLIEMVKHPIQTAEGMYTLVVEYDRTSEALKKMVDEYLALASSDPDKFAEMTGKLTGNIMVSLVTPAKVIKGSEVATTLKAVANVGRASKLYHYTSKTTMELVKKSNQLRHGAKARGVFATTAPPSIIFSPTLFGMLARGAALGGRLDFWFAAGRTIRFGTKTVTVPKLKMAVKPPFTDVVEFSSHGFKTLVRTSLEPKLAGACKSLLGQYGKAGHLNLGTAGAKFMSAANVRPTLLESMFNGMGYALVPAAVAHGDVSAAAADLPKCGDPGVECVFQAMTNEQMAEQAEEFGENPYATLMADAGAPPLREVMDSLDCCTSGPTCCGLEE